MTDVPHPATFPEAVLRVIRGLLPPGLVLDPFAGVCRLAELGPGWRVVGGDLELPWLRQGRDRGAAALVQADATRLPFRSGAFDGVATSPCLEQDRKILRSDLRWVSCGDIKVGDQVVAFDEFGEGVTILGRPARRRWRLATVTSSYPAKKECVRVILKNGESCVCTHDHPWLTRDLWRSQAASWTKASELNDRTMVLRQLDVWSDVTTYESGWLAGVFDGEGSLSFGDHGCPKLVITQVEGMVTDLVVERLRRLGYQVNVIPRKPVTGRQNVVNVYVTGGFPGILRALGELRPVRLLDKLQKLDAASRTIQPDPVGVDTVERVGVREIQGIETTTGTYIGDGYLMHNTYGNRIADTDASQQRDRAARSTDRTRRTYRGHLGAELHPGNSGGLKSGAIRDQIPEEVQAWQKP